MAAVRYFMIKYSRTKVIAFDIDEALSFEGESGPYLQYAVVRANNIFQKLQERDGVSERDVLATLATLPAAMRSLGADGDHDLWNLVLEAARLDDVVEQVCGRSSSPCWRSMGSGWRRCSTASITRRRSSTKSATTCGAGGRRRWPISASS